MEMKLPLLPILRALISRPIFEQLYKNISQILFFFGFYLFLIHLMRTNYRAHYD